MSQTFSEKMSKLQFRCLKLIAGYCGFKRMVLMVKAPWIEKQRAEHGLQPPVLTIKANFPQMSQTCSENTNKLSKLAVKILSINRR